jgi:hypothetical protein
MKSHMTARIATASALVVGVLLVVAALGGIGIAQAGGGPKKPPHGQYGQYGKKVTICHKGKRTLRVSRQAVPAHLAHGDTLGRCVAPKKKWRGKG